MYNVITGWEQPDRVRWQCQKGETMDEEMSLAELLKATAEENQTRKILAILKSSTNLDEAIEKVESLLKN